MALITKTYSYEKIQDIIDSLDLMNRIHIGQYDNIFNYIVWNSWKGKMPMTWNELDLLQNKLYSIRGNLISSLKDCSYNASLGIWNPKTPMEAIKSYDVLQVLRYQKSYHFYPQGDIGVSFYTPFIQGKWRIKEEDMETIKQIVIDFNRNVVKDKYIRKEVWYSPIAIKEFHEEDCTIICQKSVLTLINKALKVSKLVSQYKFTEVFELLYPKINKSEYQNVTDYVSKKMKEGIKDE